MEKDLKRQIDIKNAYLQMIRDLTFDYDRLNKIESLKKLIDELGYYATLALNNNDKEPIYTSYSNEKEVNSNILMEELEN